MAGFYEEERLPSAATSQTDVASRTKQRVSNNQQAPSLQERGMQVAQERIAREKQKSQDVKGALTLVPRVAAAKVASEVKEKAGAMDRFLFGSGEWRDPKRGPTPTYQAPSIQEMLGKEIAGNAVLRGEANQLPGSAQPPSSGGFTPPTPETAPAQLPAQAPSFEEGRYGVSAMSGRSAALATQMAEAAQRDEQFNQSQARAQEEQAAANTAQEAANLRNIEAGLRNEFHPGNFDSPIVGPGDVAVARAKADLDGSLPSGLSKTRRDIVRKDAQKLSLIEQDLRRMGLDSSALRAPQADERGFVNPEEAANFARASAVAKLSPERRRKLKFGESSRDTQKRAEAAKIRSEIDASVAANVAQVEAQNQAIRDKEKLAGEQAHNLRIAQLGAGTQMSIAGMELAGKQITADREASALVENGKQLAASQEKVAQIQAAAQNFASMSEVAKARVTQEIQKAAEGDAKAAQRVSIALAVVRKYGGKEDLTPEEEDRYNQALAIIDPYLAVLGKRA